MIPADRNRIELRHITGGKFDNIGHDTHRGLRRVNIGVAHHKFFENVILDRARQSRSADALLFTGHDERGQNRDDCTIHRHGYGNLIQWDAIKEDLHILDTVNRDTRFTHISNDARMIAVIAPMGGQIERHRNPLLPSRERLPVKRIGVLGCGKSSILPNSPGPTRIHSRFDTARVGLLSRNAAYMRQAVYVLSRIKWLHLDALERLPSQRLQ